MESQKFFPKNLVTRGKDSTTSRKFYHEMFILERNHESFFAMKVWSYTIWVNTSEHAGMSILVTYLSALANVASYVILTTMTNYVPYKLQQHPQNLIPT